ncbi:MAG: hypothetical protein STSR0008_19370 [Ignavibacterium sp.]
MLSLNKKIVFIIAFLFGILLFFISCDKENKDSEQTDKTNLYEQESLKKFLNKHSIKDFQYAVYDKFLDSSSQKEIDSKANIIIGKEIMNQDEWGIKFLLYTNKNDSLVKIYESKLLDGSFTESKVEPIQFPDYNYKLLFYNSQDYFMGSQGGEVFSYIIDFNLKEIYYAHLFIIQGKPISLYLSDNIKNETIRKYFVSVFTNDYPNLTIAKNDTKIEM